MSVSIVSAIAAHKVAAALIMASLAMSGGVVAVANGNHQSSVVGEMSFTINPAFNVTTLASLNLGTLSGGQTGTMSSTAAVDFTSTGNYTIGYVNTGLLHQAFSSFNVTVIGLGNQINLTLSHSLQTFKISSTGSDSLKISVSYTVNSVGSYEHGVTVTNEPFLQLFSGMTPPVPQHDGDQGGPQDSNQH
jgi:hypothetical protein